MCTSLPKAIQQIAMISNRIVVENRDYFDKFYRKDNLFYFILHSYFSFNQKSKTKVNLRILREAMVTIGKSFPPEQVLDFGCGFGTFLFQFPKEVGVFGIDISVPAIQNCRKIARIRGLKGQFIVSDGSTPFPWPDDTFDVVVTSHTLEHVPGEHFVFGEMVRCTKVGGIVLINVPINEKWPDPKHIRKYSEQRLYTLFENFHLRSILMRQSNRWDSFFLASENENSFLLHRIVLRGLKGIFAVMSDKVWIWLEKKLLSHHQYQQLIGVAQKL